jgi:hypothetical protein
MMVVCDDEESVPKFADFKLEAGKLELLFLRRWREESERE